MIGDGDEQTFLADFNAIVVFGSETVNGILDDAEESGLEGEFGSAVPVGIHTVLIETASLPGLAVGASITVDGEQMEVRRRIRVGDGKFTRLFCREA